MAEHNPMSPLRLAILIGVPLVIIGGATALFFLNPSEHSFFPKCSFYVATGFSCPGCGSTRALFHLTHGNLLEALRLNPGLMALITLGLTDYIRFVVSVIHGNPFQTLFGRLKLLGALMGVMLVYGVIRNLPWRLFESLAP
ncbi:MAG TPA: hypothetical protein DEA68_08400 [Verrucomicrobiales bacterium]|nr:hypothetical protein [Verrucomicrobiales bacterium]